MISHPTFSKDMTYRLSCVLICATVMQCNNPLFTFSKWYILCAMCITSVCILRICVQNKFRNLKFLLHTWDLFPVNFQPFSWIWNINYNNNFCPTKITRLPPKNTNTETMHLKGRRFQAPRAQSSSQSVLENTLQHQIYYSLFLKNKSWVKNRIGWFGLLSPLLPFFA